MTSRRRFLTASGYLAAASALPAYWKSHKGYAAPLREGLSDPLGQPKFVETVPNPLHPSFIYQPDTAGRYRIRAGVGVAQTGLRAGGAGAKLQTPIFGYGDQADRLISWPGRTFQISRGPGETEVIWENELENYHLLPVDTSLHWCYSLQSYTGRRIEKDGVPIVTHLHGGHSDFQFDGNPEFFYGPDRRGARLIGPRWRDVPGGFTNRFRYDNDVPAGSLWYHDHALGITRLNVYAGMAGYYFVRDALDTGQVGNPLGLPAFPYELPLAIQDRMFYDHGALFYPAFPGDPAYDDFITGEGAELPPKLFPNGGPTALAEFFGDHMVVNGKIWPRANVEPRHYRLRLLNGCDSRFLVIRFRPVGIDDTDLEGAGDPLPFHVIGIDQGLASAATLTDTLVVEPGGRYDVVFDFNDLWGKRVIMENIGGDTPFGGAYGDALDPDEDLFENRQTDRVMAFDVDVPRNYGVPDAFDPSAISAYGGNSQPAARTRRVALFEGTDEFGRLQPLLGTAEPTADATGAMVSGAIAWHAPTTERPGLGDTEIWEIYNATGDAHPVHLHLVNFQVLGRQAFSADLIQQPVEQHNGTLGEGFRLENIALGATIPSQPEYVDNAPRDMVTALPEQVTRIKVTFDKPGRYVWHCHILSHEDHEMMRVLQVQEG